MDNSSGVDDASPPISIDRDQLQYLVAQQVGLAMDKFSTMYSKAFHNLELAIFGDLLPRLSSPMKSHARVVRRVQRRLDKLRPFVVNSRRDTYDEIIEEWKRQKHHKRDKKDKKHEKKATKQRQLKSDSDFQLSLRPPQCTPCDSCHEPLPLKTPIDRKRLQLIYQNDLFPTMPDSVVKLPRNHQPSLTLARHRLSPSASVSGSGSETRSASDANLATDLEPCSSEIRDFERRLLHVNLVKNKSFLSIHLNRHKFPAIWKYFYEQKLKKQVSKNRIPLNGMRSSCYP